MHKQDSALFGSFDARSDNTTRREIIKDSLSILISYCCSSLFNPKSWKCLRWSGNYKKCFSAIKSYANFKYERQNWPL